MMCTCLVTNHINSARSRPAPPVTTKGHVYDLVYPNPGEAAYNAATAVHDPLKEHDKFVIMAQPLLPHLAGAVYDRHLRGLGPWTDPHWRTAVQLCPACCVAPPSAVSCQKGRSQATSAQDHKKSSCNSVHGRELLASAYLLFTINAARQVCHTCMQATCEDTLHRDSRV